MLKRFDLNLERGDRQRYFLDNLNSALRTLTSSSTGSAGLSEDGLFRSTVTSPFPVETSHVPLTWEVVKAADGTLLNLNVTCTDPSVDETRWTTPVYDVVTRVLAAALSEKRMPFFQRSLFFYLGPQLDGEYWLPGGYRLAPVDPDDPEPFLINAERVVTIDMVVDAVDEHNARTLAWEAARRHAARLSLLLSIGLYRGISQEHRWVMPIQESGAPAAASVRYAVLFARPGLSLESMPRKGELCALGGYKGSLTAKYRWAGERLSLPPQARKILRGVDLAQPVIVDAFDRGARLYQVGTVVGYQFPSVGLAYRIAAVESIARADPTARSFGEFMRKYTTTATEVDTLLDYMWGSVRSAHFHGGEFPLGEFARVAFFDPLMDPEDAQRSTIHRVCHELTREAIVNWMMSLLPKRDEQEDADDPDEEAAMQRDPGPRRQGGGLGKTASPQ